MPAIADAAKEGDGRQMRWAHEAMARELSQEGWCPVTERDATERPAIFMDRKGEVILIYRATNA